ncbi:MAG: aminomethyl-transferring glycine dehydrogenase subunit GcvPA [bacterium]
MRYFPHTPEDVSEMLQAIGASGLEDLFKTVPETCRRGKPLDLPEPLTEWELSALVSGLADTVEGSSRRKVYLGAGSYEHYIPHVVPYLLGRSEFVTSYTPYQPEMSQGTLQAIYEYQTLVCRLLGMEVANASIYDGASALAEAVLMAIRVTRRKRVAVSGAVHPSYRQVLRTYLAPAGFELIELPRLRDGRTDLAPVEGLEDLAAVALQSPSFFGCIEDLAAAAEAAHRRKALAIACFTEPLAYGLLRNPGSQGADIACGEGQSLGVPQSFGGPGIGMFATRTEYMRNIPGRLVGKAADAEGRKGFVLTLATREQHIRREKATSNICTNNSLCALAAAMYMAALGGTGFRELARLNHDKSEYLKKKLVAAGFRLSCPSPTFNEFAVEAPVGFERTYERLLANGIVAGLPLRRFYPDLERHYLFCVTETKTRDDLDELVEEMRA